MKLKDGEKERINHCGFTILEANDIETGIAQTASGTLHNFNRQCFAALAAHPKAGERIVWPPKFQTQEAEMKICETFGYLACTDDEREDIARLLVPVVDQIASRALRASIARHAENRDQT